MPHEWQLGRKFYQVIWERDGERIMTVALHASDETDAQSKAVAKHAQEVDRTGTTIRVREITFPLSRDDDY
jgi:hypothetical protein